MTTTQWLHGLGSAAIGGVLVSLAGAGIDPGKFDLFSVAGVEHLATLAFFGAITAAGFYVKQFPVAPSIAQDTQHEPAQK